MLTIYPSILKPRVRPLAAALATFFVASTGNGQAQAASLAVPHGPASVRVDNCNDSGVGSLREALNIVVNTDVVDLTHLTCSTISLTSGALVIGQSDLTLIGPGEHKLAIDGRNTGAVLYHLGNGNLSVAELSIVNGHKYRKDGSASGACIHTNGNLYLDHVSIDHCRASALYGRSAFGGAVYVMGDATIDRSTISNSSAVADATAVALGGGLCVLGGLSMGGSTIADNSASGGGFGGALYARGPVTLNESTVSANHADLSGGGIWIGNVRGEPATVINSTVSGNTALQVGGVLAFTSLNLYNSTVAFNTSTQWTRGNGQQHYAAGVHIGSASVMHSSIISNNKNAGAPTSTADVTGTPTSVFTGGHDNVMFCDIVCPAGTTTDDPGLHPLQDNGGPTRTHVPTPGIWHRLGGTNVRNVPWDQRGQGFPRTSAPDPIEIGAFQTNPEILFVNGFN